MSSLSLMMHTMSISLKSDWPSSHSLNKISYNKLTTNKYTKISNKSMAIFLKLRRSGKLAKKQPESIDLFKSSQQLSL